MSENYSTNELIESIQNSDTTVEIIGYVDQIVTPYHSKGTRNLRFVLNNNQGKRIQVIAWNDIITEVEKMVHSVNLIIHVNGATAHIPKDRIYNKGNICYELIITESTSITVEGIHEIEKKEVEITCVKLGDCTTKVGSVIKIRAYISCTFGMVQAKNYTFYVASVTDGYYKLEIRSKTDLINTDLTIGTQVEITGLLEKQKKGPYQLKIDNLENIKTLKGKKMRLENILAGYHNV